MAEEETEFWEGMTNMNRNPEMGALRGGVVIKGIDIGFPVVIVVISLLN